MEAHDTDFLELLDGNKQFACSNFSTQVQFGKKSIAKDYGRMC